MEETSVSSHVDVANIEATRDECRLNATLVGINGSDATWRGHKQDHIAESEGADVGIEGDRRGHVDQCTRLGSNHPWSENAIGEISGGADAIFNDAIKRGDWLKSDRGVCRATAKRAVEGRGELLIGGNRHVVRGGSAGISSWQEYRTDERIELAKRATREVVEVVCLIDARLIVGDVGVTADVDQPPLLVKDGHREIAAETVGIVDVKQRGPALAAGVDTPDGLDLLVVEREAVPVDVVLATHRSGNTNRVAIGREQVAERLGLANGVVDIVGILAILAGELRVARKTDDVDADCWISKFTVADG